MISTFRPQIPKVFEACVEGHIAQGGEGNAPQKDHEPYSHLAFNHYSCHEPFIIIEYVITKEN